ncbi:MAG: DUF1080 domain-containing protein [Chitinophagaceae bacterium]|nr:MAG: DUF1080 domain-containing protein [Chitinophagaceae bacterium]
MKKGILSVLMLMVMMISTQAQGNRKPGIEGRWDIQISKDGKVFPSWLEVVHSGNRSLVGYFVGISGSSRPVSRINISGDKFDFAIPPQWEDGDADLKVEGNFDGTKLSGTITMPDTKAYPFTAARAPSLRKPVDNIQWGTPVKIFNGKDLTGFTALGNNQWVVQDGILRSPKSGSNIRTDQSFNDFKLHIEFRYPKGSNSGVYLRGRYEVQISDNKGGEPTKGDYGAVYGFIAPNEMVAKAAGEWQTYDITLIGRMVTVVANGKTIISNQEIPGITGGALDSNEGQPGPLMIQGDHGAIEYRNIVVTPAR